MKNFRTSPIAMSGSRRSSSGFLLLEVLVALLIFAFGVLGIVGLQAAMTTARTSAKLRGEAAYLAQELIGTMWADIPNLDQYVVCTGNAKCQAVALKVGTLLPQGSLVVERPAPGLFTITIGWTPPNETTHLYVTSTAIKT